MIWRGLQRGWEFVYMARTGLNWAFLSEIPSRASIYGLYIDILLAKHSIPPDMALKRYGCGPLNLKMPITIVAVS